MTTIQEMAQELTVPATSYDQACVLLAKAVSIDEVKNVHDKSAAIQAYARQTNQNGMLKDAYKLRARSLRRMGEMMSEQKATIGLAPRGVKKGSKKNGPYGKLTIRGKNNPELPTLDEVGVDKNLAKAARKAAKPTESEFKKMEATWEKRYEETGKVKPLVIKPKETKKKATATNGSEKTTKRKRRTQGINLNELMAEYCADCNTEETRWQRSAEVHLSALAALTAYWDREFKEEWRQYNRTSELLALVEAADKAWPILIGSIRKREE